MPGSHLPPNLLREWGSEMADSGSRSVIEDEESERPESGLGIGYRGWDRCRGSLSGIVIGDRGRDRESHIKHQGSDTGIGHRRPGPGIGIGDRGSGSGSGAGVNIGVGIGGSGVGIGDWHQYRDQDRDRDR